MLVEALPPRQSGLMAVTTIFDRSARALRRDRVVAGNAFEAHVIEALIDRIDTVKRRFARALVINAGSGLLVDALRARAMTVVTTEHGTRIGTADVRCAEDALPLDLIGFDLVIAAAGFDTVDDLPGALLLARRALVPDGLFLGCMVGAPSLPALRRAAAAADALDSGTAVARIHPQVDVRAAGDLLVRAGFALGVADAETLTLAYPSLGRLITDLRDAGATNVLTERSGVTRGWLAAAAAAFADLPVDGRTIETITLLMLTGWAPSDSQPKPAVRGSATASLSAALARAGDSDQRVE